MIELRTHDSVLTFALLILLFYLSSFKFYKLLTFMENTFQLNEFNDVDFGDDSLTVDPTPRSSVSTSTKGTPDEHVNVVSPVVVEYRDGASGEGGSAAFQKKEM